MKKNLVILLTKNPEPGKVKTRLGKVIGFDKASEIQKYFIKKILKNNYSSNEYDFKVGLKGKENIEKFSSYFGVDKKDIFNQVGTDLGLIMNNAIKYGLNNYERVIITGSDIPLLNGKDFMYGFNKLVDKDIVIGKANDGGYYLIGMKKENKDLFKDIVYSLDTVLDKTIEKIDNYNLKYHLLDEKIDIDTFKDLLLASKQDNTGFLTNILNECEIEK